MLAYRYFKIQTSNEVLAELALKHNHAKALPQALDAMAEELSLVIMQISAALGDPGKSAGDKENSSKVYNSNPAIINHGALKLQLQQLSTLPINNDTRAEKQLNSISDALHSLDQGELVTQLNEIIAKYEFEAAFIALTASTQALDISS